MYSPVLNTKQRLTHSHSGDKKWGVLGPIGAVTSSFRRVLGSQVSLAYSPGSPMFQCLGKVLSLKWGIHIPASSTELPSVLVKWFSPYSKGQLLQHQKGTVLLFLSSTTLSCPKPGEASKNLSRLSSWGTGPHLHIRVALFKQSQELEAQGVPERGKQTWAAMGPPQHRSLTYFTGPFLF